MPPTLCIPPDNNSSIICTFGTTDEDLNQGRIICDAPCSTNTFGLAFTATYIFFGIPMFASVMGFAADIYISRFQRQQVSVRFRLVTLRAASREVCLVLAQAREAAASSTAEMTERTFVEMAHLNIDMQPRASIMEAHEGVDFTVTRPSIPTTRSVCAALARLTPLTNPGSLYRGGKGT